MAFAFHFNATILGDETMALKELVIGDIVLKHPIIQGGMGVGVSLCRLAGAVSNYGGLGIISAAQIGFLDEDFDKTPLAANLKAIYYHIKKAKELANGNPVGINIMCVTNNYEQYVTASVEAGCDIIISGAGIPVHLPRLVKGSSTKIAPIVSSKKATDIILRMWDKKYHTTADLIVVEGPKAGGHLGFSLKNIEKDFSGEIPLILESVKQYEEKYGKKIPVVFAGGVFDKSDIEHYMNIGLDGVQMATRFVTTFECDAHDNFKQAYINAKKEDIVIVKSPVGMPGRAINNLFLENLKTKKDVINKCFNCIIGCNPVEVPYCITKALIHSVTGKIDSGLIFASESVSKLDKIISVRELMDELTGN